MSRLLAQDDPLERKNRVKKRFRKIKTTIVAMKAFEDAGHQRKARRGNQDSGSYKTLKIDEDSESKIVSAARSRQTAVPGPRVDESGFHYSNHGRLKNATSGLQDIRQHTIVTHHIVLGCREDAMDLQKLKSIGVTHVLNTCKQLPNYHRGHLIYHKLPLIDAPHEHIVECCEISASFLQRVERVGGRALVHCIAGSSRSVCCVLMHLMVSHCMHLHDAFSHIRKLRPQANPNEGFKLQLALLEVKIHGGSSVASRDSGSVWNFYEWNVRKAAVPKLPQRRDRRRSSVSGDPTSGACAVQ